MERIKFADQAVADPVTGVPIFQEAIPSANGTFQRDYWFNAVQEEIAAVIEGAGITLSGASRTQLRDAIKKNHAFTSNTTLTVNGSAPYPTLNAAIAALEGRYIAPGVTVSIQMQTGMSHTISTPVIVTHPQGDQIEIKGNNATPVTVNCNPTSYGREGAAITAKNGGKIKLISGLFMNYDTSNAVTVPVFAIRAGQGGTIGLGDGMDINNFRGAGVVAEDGGVITVTYSKVRDTNITGFLAADALIYGAGYWARRGGKIFATSAISNTNYAFNYLAETTGLLIATACSSTLAAFGSRWGGVLHAFSCTSVSGPGDAGFSAKEGSSLHATGCTTGTSGSNVCYIGFHADSGSTIWADTCTGAYAVKDGFRAINGSRIIAKSCTADHNTESGFNCSFSSFISHVSCASTNNGFFGYFAATLSCMFGAGTSTGSGNTGGNYSPTLGAPDTDSFARND